MFNCIQHSITYLLKGVLATTDEEIEEISYEIAKELYPTR